MTAAAWLQAAATCVLIVVTAFYVLHTWRIVQLTAEAANAARDSACAAKQSAESAEKLVKLEQRKAMLASVPQLALSH